MSRHSDLIHTLHHIWSSGDLSLVEKVYAADFCAYWPKSAAVPVRRGHEGVVFGVKALRDAFPDWHETVVDVFCSGDRVASRTIARGTHLAPFGDLNPSGRRIEIHEMSSFRIAGDRVVEHHCLFDEMARLRGLGADASYLRKMLKQ